MKQKQPWWLIYCRKWCSVRKSISFSITGNGPLRSFQNFSVELAPQSLIDPHFKKIKSNQHPEFSSYLTGSRGIHTPFSYPVIVKVNIHKFEIKSGLSQALRLCGHIWRWHFKFSTGWTKKLSLLKEQEKQRYHPPTPRVITFFFWHTGQTLLFLLCCARLKEYNIDFISFLNFFFFFFPGSPTFSYPTTPTNNTPPQQQPPRQVKTGEIILRHISPIFRTTPSPNHLLCVMRS